MTWEGGKGTNDRNLSPQKKKKEEKEEEQGRGKERKRRKGTEVNAPMKDRPTEKKGEITIPQPTPGGTMNTRRRRVWDAIHVHRIRLPGGNRFRRGREKKIKARTYSLKRARCSNFKK